MSAFARLLLLSLISVSLAACSGGDDKKKSGGTEAIPEDVPLAIPQSKPVSDEKAGEFMAIFGATTPMNLAELVWGEKPSTSTPKLEAFAQLLKANRECTISGKKTTSESGSRETGRITTKSASVTGLGCPLSATYSDRSTITVMPGATPGNATISLDVRQDEAATSTHAENGLSVTEISRNQTITGTIQMVNNVQSSIMNYAQKSFVRLRATGEGVSMRAEGRLLAKNDDRDGANLLNIYSTYRGTDFVLTVYIKKTGGGTPTSRLFVNGKEYSAQNKIQAAAKSLR